MNTLNLKIEKIRTTSRIIIEIIRVWPFFTFCVVLLGIFSIAIPIAKIALIEKIVSLILPNNTPISISQFLPYIAIFSFVFLLELVFQSRAFLDYFGSIYQEKFLLRNYSTFLRNRAYISLEEFENVELQNTLERIKNFFNNDFSLTLITFQRIITIGALTITMIIKIGQYNVLLAIFLIIMTIIILLYHYRITKTNLVFNKTQTLLNRRISYLFELFTNKNALIETQVYHNSEFLHDKWQKTIKQSLKEINENFKNLFSLQMQLGLLSSVYTVLSIIVLYYLNFYGFQIPIPTFTALIYTIQQFTSNIDSLMQRYNLVYSFFYLAQETLEFNEKYAIPTQVVIDKRSVFKEKIQLNNIYYRYPRAKDYALKDICLTINDGEKIAIVGENGAGKTTLTKIIMGLLKASKGSILLDCQNLDQLDIQIYFKNFSCVFQHIPRYMLDFKENITLSYVDKIYSDSEFKELLTKLDMNSVVNKLPNKENTILNKELGDSDLSGGEWQKVSILRALYRDSKIIIFDEPTSAIDPLAEYEIYNMIHKLFIDKTVVFISHRLASTKFVDKIIFMENGFIKEVGNHNQLMSANGLYSNLFTIQQQWYRRKPLENYKI